MKKQSNMQKLEILWLITFVMWLTVGNACSRQNIEPNPIKKIINHHFPSPTMNTGTISIISAASGLTFSVLTYYILRSE